MPELKITRESLERALRAAPLFASTDKLLPVLTAVHLTYSTTAQRVVVESTDRYVLAQVALDVDEATDAADLDFLLEPADVKSALDWLKRLPAARTHGAEAAFVTLSHTDGTARLASPVSAIDWQAKPFDGDYPKIGKLIEGEYGHAATGQPAVAFQPALLAKFGKLGALDKSLPLHFAFQERAGKPTLVQMGEWFQGLIMPVRVGDTVAKPW